jgi:hypothetical protein
MFGKWPSREDLDDRLRQLSRTDVVLRLAWCNAVTVSWRSLENNDVDKRVCAHLFPFWADDVRRWTTTYGEGFMFSRFTILWLMRQAFTTCAPDGVRLDNEEHFRMFGEACLIANDLSAFPNPKPLPTDLAVAANMLPNTEYFSQEEYDRDIARTLYMFEDLASNAPGTQLPALAQRLQELLGYTVRDYCDLAVACAMKPLAADTTSIEDFQIPTLRLEQFTTTNVSLESAERFLHSIGADENTFQHTIAQGHAHAADLTLFRDKPLLNQVGSFVPLDTGFILDKAGRSLFWTALKNSAARDERERILADYGHLFERYVNSVLAASLGPTSTLLPAPCFPDGAEAFDGAVRENGTLIVMEYKSSTINNVIRYADDPTALEQVLEKRFIQGEGQGYGRKGVAQLSHAIKRFTEGDPIIVQSADIEVTPDRIYTIMPVLVHLDNALRTPGIPHYMTEQFKNLGRFKRFTVTPIVLLPIAELEELEGHLHDNPLSAFLESFLAMLRSDRATVFLTRILPILHGQRRKVGGTIGRFDQYLDRLTQRLFANGFEEAAPNPDRRIEQSEQS